jgi:hypothetical protein
MTAGKLLDQYYKESSILSKAYGMMEGYHRRLHKYLSYPTIPLASLVGIISVIPNKEDYHLHIAITLLSFTIAVLNGFHTAINPKDKEHNCNNIKTEFNEISSNINQYLNENNKTELEYKNYSSQVLELLEVWKSLSPPCKQTFLDSSTKHFTERLSLVRLNSTYTV